MNELAVSGAPFIGAIGFTSLVGASVLFQLALLFGAPWGQLAMGGKFPGRWPWYLRLTTLLNITLLSGMAVMVLIRASLCAPEYFQLSQKLIWGVVVVSTLSFIMNSITSSKWERRLWAPTTLLMLLCSVIVAMG